MATLTVTGTVVRANDALAELMSCEPYDLVGVDYGQLTSGAGDQLDRGLDADHRPREGPRHHRARRCPTRRTSASRIVRLTLAPIRDAQQQVLYVFAQVQDITALRAAEGDLRLSEENFRLLVAAVERVRHLHARPRRDRGQLERRRPAHQGILAGRDRRSLVPGLLPAGGPRHRPSRAATWRPRAGTASSPRRGGGYARTAASSGPAS